MHGSPPACQFTQPLKQPLGSDNTLTSPDTKFSHWSIRAVNESEASRRLQAEARSKAEKIKTLRFRLYEGGGMGGENSNFDILRCWQRLTPGTLKKAEFIYTPKEIPALKALVPDWPAKQAYSKIQTLPVNGFPCDFIPVNCLTSLPTVPFSVVGSASLETIGSPLKSLRANTCLSLQPLHWIYENALIYAKSQSAVTLPLEVPKDNHLPVAGSHPKTISKKRTYS